MQGWNCSHNHAWLSQAHDMMRMPGAHDIIRLWHVFLTTDNQAWFWLSFHPCMVKTHCLLRVLSLHAIKHRCSLGCPSLLQKCAVSMFLPRVTLLDSDRPCSAQGTLANSTRHCFKQAASEDLAGGSLHSPACIVQMQREIQLVHAGIS